MEGKRKREPAKKHKNKKDAASLSGILKEKICSAKESFYLEMLPTFVKCAPRNVWKYLTPAKDKTIEYVVFEGEPVRLLPETPRVTTLFCSVFVDSDNSITNGDILTDGFASDMRDVVISEEGFFRYF